MRCSRKYEWWGGEKKVADVLQQRVLSLDSEKQEHVDQRVEAMDTLVKHELFLLYNLSTDLLGNQVQTRTEIRCCQGTPDSFILPGNLYWALDMQKSL